jgi:hypothetical protein
MVEGLKAIETPAEFDALIAGDKLVRSSREDSFLLVFESIRGGWFSPLLVWTRSGSDRSSRVRP